MSNQCLPPDPSEPQPEQSQPEQPQPFKAVLHQVRIEKIAEDPIAHTIDVGCFMVFVDVADNTNFRTILIPAGHIPEIAKALIGSFDMWLSKNKIPKHNTRPGLIDLFGNPLKNNKKPRF